MEKTKRNWLLIGLLVFVMMFGLCLCFGLGGNQVQTVHATDAVPPPWDDNLGEGYTVSFNSNGGTGTMTAEKNISSSYTLPDCTFTPPSGKQFLCWAKNSTTGTQYNSGTQYNVNDDVTFYAVWEDIPEIQHTVSFNSNGGSGTMAGVQYAGTYTLPACTFTAPEG